MSASDKIFVNVIGSNPEAVEAVSHSIGANLLNDGFHNTMVTNINTGEPEVGDNSMLDLLRKSNPAIFDTNIQVVSQFDAPESDAVSGSDEVESEEDPIPLDDDAS